MAEAPLSADEIAHRGFPSTFRGFDPAEVRAYLVRIANELKAAEARERELQQRLTEAEHRAANPVIDQAMLTRALGEETSRVLVSAQDAAHDLKARAEESVAGILREAHEQAQRIRGEAEVVLAQRTDEADTAAGEILAAAQAEARAVVEQARREAEDAHTELTEQSRQLVHEAQAARARVLGDLTRRRRIAHMQVEQLRAGRERLLEAYRVVRRTLDEVADELERVESEARSAASAAGRRVEAAMDAAEAADEDLDGAGEELVVTGPELQDSDSAAPSGLTLVAAAPSSAGADPPQEAPAPTSPEPAAEGEPRTRPVPPTAAPPVVAREEHVEERKLSSLRILRRPKPDEHQAPEFEVVEVRSEFEGVRVIAGSAEPGRAVPAPPPRVEREGPSITPGISWAPPPPVPAPAPAVPEEPPAAPGPAAAPQVAAGPTAAPAPDPAAEETPAAATEPSAPTSPVDALFARIRADRAGDADPAGRAPGDAGPTPAGGGPPVATTSVIASPVRPPHPEPERFAERRPEAPTSAPPAGAPPDLKGPDEEESLLGRRDEAIEGIEAALTRRLKRALQDEHNDVLDRLRSCRGVPDPAAFLPSPADQGARYAAAAGELLRDAARAGARFVSPHDSSTSAPDVSDVVAELTEALVGPLRRGVERGVEGGQEDSSALVDCIGAAYRECKSHRLERLAGDATIAAFSLGTVSAASDATFRWVVDDGQRACPDCDDNALAGPTQSGQKYPTGQKHPPAHAGCRCLLVLTSP